MSGFDTCLTRKSTIHIFYEVKDSRHATRGRAPSSLCSECQTRAPSDFSSGRCLVVGEFLDAVAGVHDKGFLRTGRTLLTVCQICDWLEAHRGTQRASRSVCLLVMRLIFA